METVSDSEISAVMRVLGRRNKGVRKRMTKAALRQRKDASKRPRPRARRSGAPLGPFPPPNPDAPP